MHALFVRPPTPPHLCSHGRCKCRSHLCRKPRARWNMPSVESVDIHARPGKELTQRLEDAVAGLKGRLLTQRYPEPDSGRRWQSISGKAVRSNAWTGVLLDRTWRQNGPCRLTASHTLSVRVRPPVGGLCWFACSRSVRSSSCVGLLCRLVRSGCICASRGIIEETSWKCRSYIGPTT